MPSGMVSGPATVTVGDAGREGWEGGGGGREGEKE